MCWELWGVEPVHEERGEDELPIYLAVQDLHDHGIEKSSSYALLLASRLIITTCALEPSVDFW